MMSRGLKMDTNSSCCVPPMQLDKNPPRGRETLLMENLCCCGKHKPDNLNKNSTSAKSSASKLSYHSFSRLFLFCVRETDRGRERKWKKERKLLRTWVQKHFMHK